MVGFLPISLASVIDGFIMKSDGSLVDEAKNEIQSALVALRVFKKLRRLWESGMLAVHGDDVFRCISTT